MTREDIIKLANDMAFMACIWIDDEGNEINDLVKFAQLVAAASRKETLEEMIYAHPTTAIEKAVAYEREACAKLCEELRDDWLRGLGRYEFMGEGADYCADAIRERVDQC